MDDSGGFPRTSAQSEGPPDNRFQKRATYLGKATLLLLFRESSRARIVREKNRMNPLSCEPMPSAPRVYALRPHQKTRIIKAGNDVHKSDCLLNMSERERAHGS